MSQRVIFFNPHTHGLYKRSVHQVISRYPVSDKLGYILEHYIRNRSLNVLLNAKESSFPIPLPFRNVFFAKFEFYIWCKLHGIKYSDVNIIINGNELASNDWVVMTIKNINRFSVSALSKLKSKKIINTNHFMTSAEKRSNFIKSIGCDHYWSEAKLQYSGFFKKYYGNTTPVSFIPYVPSERFKNKVPFDQRRNKCVALGSVYCFSNADPAVNALKEYYGADTYHPSRKAFFENRKKLAEVVDVFIEPFKGHDHCLKEKGGSISRNRYGDYYSVDLVELMNQYKMVSYGEEINDMPALGMYEAMMCGCVIVGSSSRIYTDIGLVDDVSYISYGKSLDVGYFKKKIQKYLDNPEELDRLSEASYENAMKRISKRDNVMMFEKMTIDKTTSKSEK